ncbi:Pyridoxal biosynthesis protein PDX1.1 [Acorus gramineus]|uniref:Pyridoxal biosynthesis protein PDX1.1 n=1 Tax=Acorus gramineus TaxID=55184 RepID=A0AAV9AA32_ACOGR|nr:Pyridoxal biosynthesis protein PDX1.1 [Acorus gramineus]
MAVQSEEDRHPDDGLCSPSDRCSSSPADQPPPPPLEPLSASPGRLLDGEWRIERAWAHWRKIGEPKTIVAPMVDNSELPFRMLCRKYGAAAAYTPMLHSRIFSENENVAFLVWALLGLSAEARTIVAHASGGRGVGTGGGGSESGYGGGRGGANGGGESGSGSGSPLWKRCPQRIARRGNYGAFLMDNLPVIRSLVQNLAVNLHVPVSCKIRIFPRLQDTIAYAKMLEEAGCSLLAVHGRTRDQKDGKKYRADWEMIKAVKQAVRIPVLANGNIRHMDDVQSCLDHTGADGVLSAETLLENPALFAGFRTAEWREGDGEMSQDCRLDQAELLVEYLKLCERYPVPWRIIRSHVHKLLGDWFRIHPEIREELNVQWKLTFEWLYGMVDRLREKCERIPLYERTNCSRIVIESSGN